MSKRCPDCGSDVPDNSLTCPSCYRKIERVTPETKTQHNAGFTENRRKIAMILSFVPGIFGIMGLGQLSMGIWKRGAFFLVTGVLLMTMLVWLVMGFIGTGVFETVIAIGLTVFFGIIYLIILAAQILDCYITSMALMMQERAKEYM